MSKQVKVVDIEQFKNFHSIVAYDIHTEEYTEFVAHESRNEFPQYVQWLEDCQKMAAFIGYNIIGYDYPLMHYILTNKNALLNMSTADLVAALYKEGQRIINEDRSDVPYWKWRINLLDLFRVHHFDNKAKRTSLKALQVAMRWPRVQDLPFKYNHWVDASEIDAIQEYCKNDVMSTYEFYKHSRKEIDFRKRMKKSYGINCMNFPDVKIGEEILIIENAKSLNVTPFELRQMRTYRDMIPLKDVILPYVKFNSKEFNTVLNHFNTTVVNAEETKGAADFSVLYGGVKYDFGLGGIHGTCGNGVFRSDDEGDLILVDVSSYYPNLAIRNKFYPEHLSERFCDVGEKLYDRRMKAKEEGDMQMVGAIKLALNGALFGKSNEKFSPMYDTKFMLSITINGQLLLCMAAEEITDAGIKIIQINTDGILVKCSKEQRPILDEICDRWMKLTDLQLDYDYFNVIAQRDVNNYLGQYTNGKIKYKGTFDIIKAWNKDHSMRVVSQAVSDFFINGTPVRETIENCSNIYDFCLSQKVGSQFVTEHHHIVNGERRVDELQKINRFFVSTNGGSLIKVNRENGRTSRLVAGNKIKLFNDYYESDNYDIYYDFYVAEANKILNAVESGQLDLFAV